MRPTWLALAAAAALLVAAGPVWLPGVGLFLVVRDPVQSADAIVVLAGNAPERLRVAQALFRAGYAPLVVVSNERVRSHGLDTTWLDLRRAGLPGPDLPDAALLVLDDPPPESTIDEARRTAVLLAERGLRSAILVTDEFHSRRASMLFGAEFRRRGLQVRSSPAANPEVDLAGWWRGPKSAITVAEEYTKLAAYLVQGAYW